MSVEVHRGRDRFRTFAPGVQTWHCFSAGAHYDPGNVAFGPLVGFDEHLVEPGAGFARHAHRGVDILSWVLEGTLRHEDGSGRVELIGPGLVPCQRTGSGMQHSETNPALDEPLRFLQMTLLGDAGPPGYAVAPPPVQLPPGRLAVYDRGPVSVEGPAHLYVVHGEFDAAGHRLGPGDSLRRTADPVTVKGAGELVVWTFTPPPT